MQLCGLVALHAYSLFLCYLFTWHLLVLPCRLLDLYCRVLVKYVCEYMEGFAEIFNKYGLSAILWLVILHVHEKKIKIT